MEKIVQSYYKLLLVLACLSLVAAFVTVMLGVAAREFHWDIQGLDAYAGFSIAAALFLALPETLRHGDHIRVTLLLQRLPARLRGVMEWWCLGAGLALTVFLAWFALRLVWISYTTHDVSTSADATPLWIPQIAMALGCVGLAIAFADAVAARLSGREFFPPSSDEIAHVE